MVYRLLKCRKSKHKAKCLLMAAAIIMGAVSGCSEPTAIEYLRQAKDHHDQNNHEAEIIALKNALQQNAKNTEARWLLGKAYLKQGDGITAEKELRRALELGLDQDAVRIPLARALLLQQKHRDVLETLPDESTVGKAQAAEVLAIRGKALAALGQVEKAHQALAQAALTDEDSSEGQLGLARLMLQEKNYPRAEELIETILQRDPENFEALVMAGQLRHTRFDFEGAAQAFTQAIKERPENLNAHLGLVEAQINLEEYDLAEKQLDRLLKLNPELPTAHYQRARIRYQQRDLEGAEESLQMVLRAEPTHPRSNLMMGAVYLAQRNPDQADFYLARYRSYQPQNVQGAKLHATALINLGKANQAIEALESVRNEAGEDAELLAMLGEAYRMAGDLKRSEEFLQQAAAIDPDSAKIRTAQAASQLAQGSSDQAVAHLEQALALDPNLAQAESMLVGAHLRDRDPEGAIAAAQRLVAQKPEDAQSHHLLGTAYLAKGDTGKARESLEKARALDSTLHSATFNLAVLAYREGDVEMAERLYKDVLEQEAGHLEALLKLAALSAVTGSKEDSRAWLEEAWEKHPGALQPGLLLVRYYQSKKNFLKAVGIARELTTKHPDNPTALKTLAIAREAAGENASAMRDYQKLVELQPQSPEASTLLARAQFKEKDWENAMANLQNALVQDERYFPALLLQAGLFQAQDRNEEAIAVSRKLQQYYLNRSEGYRLEGEMQFRQKNYTAAARAYHTAFQKTPTQQLLILAADAYAKSGESQTGEGMLLDWLKQYPEAEAVQTTLAVILQRRGRYDEALTQYMALYKSKPDNPIILNNIASLYLKQGDVRSVEFAESAYRLSGGQPEIADTLGWVLIHNDQLDRGLKLLQEASQASAHPAIKYHLAVAYQQVGRNNDARETLQQVLKDYPSFAERADAKALLERISN